MIGTALLGEHYANVASGSMLDAELEAWAREVGTYTPAVRRVEDMLRPLLRAEGLVALQSRYRSQRCEHTGTIVLNRIDTDDPAKIGSK